MKFTTTLAPAETAFVSVIWSFKGVSIITSININVTDSGYENRIFLERSTGSLELSNLVEEDSGEYAVSIITSDQVQRQGRITLDIYGGFDLEKVEE